MKITKEYLIGVIKEEISAVMHETEGGDMNRARLKFLYGFNPQEVEATLAFLDGDDREFETAYRKDSHGYEVSPYDMLLKHYSENGEMPYGTQKARDGDPFDWLFDRITRELGGSL